MNLISFNCKILTDLKQSFNITYIHNDRALCSILEVLENNNIPLHYQCRSGYCGSCRVILKKGTIKYYKSPLALCIFPGEILTCCCYPTDHIILQI